MLESSYVRRVAIALIGFAMSSLVAVTGHAAPSQAEALSIGSTWTIDSAVLGEKRRINVYMPAGPGAGKPLPVMYMPDGGMLEDFLHVAGLLQVGAGNGTTRPFLLVGIENTERRRDLTGPTDNAKDRSIAPRVGGSQAFRKFLRTELMPEIAKRYAVTSERAIVGESLAGLFVLETLVMEPDLFDVYIAIDPSLWWNSGALAKRVVGASTDLKAGKSLYIATSADGQAVIDGADVRAGFSRWPGLKFNYQDWPGESHATIYHPAALKAFRTTLQP
ncbi:alpha/beta hydrolase-fold protein [Massilia sp. R2A-15]|uniref:alpha/beta hydrolase n=1 Tax=Massilia sp. R2A-15 TaxID=3064278 RepID=UPI002735FDA6|nr:alpha/beta hydrolase-fold protein [Massilia sp. R2A-15]WLI88793.1 alpha/beta hydrolase-fold protein [Massilia sp. R2A-15]